MAREIHDELGQALTALRIDLAWLVNKCTVLTTRALPKSWLPHISWS